MKDYYNILGLDASASPDQIRAAYRSLSKKLHPDINKAADATESFILLQKAYETLINDKSKKEYDETLSSYIKNDDIPSSEEPEQDKRSYITDVKLHTANTISILFSDELILPKTYMFTRVNDLKRSHGIYVNSLFYYIGVIIDIVHFFLFWLFSINRVKAVRRVTYTFVGSGILFISMLTIPLNNVAIYYIKSTCLSVIIIYVASRIMYLGYIGMLYLVSKIRK